MQACFVEIAKRGRIVAHRLEVLEGPVAHREQVGFRLGWTDYGPDP
jgi:hypothetical protein